MWIKSAAIALFASILATAPVSADPPHWAGKGKGKHGKHQGGDTTSRHEGGHGKSNGRFEERHHLLVREYYGDQFRAGKKCPPGLAKKNNGCMPPGQAKKWHVGQPLPREVVYHEVPRALVIKLPQPSAGQRYVRVAADILLIAVGTGMVIDAIQDLGRI